jgi:ribose transport system substrate-binding protein
MEVYKRQQAILSLLEERGEVTVEDLAVRLAVSANTIRNDLNTMEIENLLRRVRGGAVALESGHIRRKAFAVRARAQHLVKAHIGRWAAGLVKNGDAIVLDASTTVFHVATFLRDRQDLTVVTNGLEVALLLAQNPSNRVLLAANLVRSDGLSLVGNLNQDLFNGFNASLGFISCSGLSIKQGFTEADVDEASLKSQMLKLARQVVALVDHTKLEKIYTVRFAELNQINHLVTDDEIEPGYLSALRQVAGFPITMVGASSIKTFEPFAVIASRPRYRIGFGNMTEKMVFAQQVRRSLERAAQKMGNIELFSRDNNLDYQTALENADWFVSNGVDLVIEYQIDAEAGNVIMDKFKRAGIPAVAVDIPLPGATFFGADNYRAGYMAGEGLADWIKKNWQGRLDILIKLEAPRVGSMGKARLQGLTDGLESVIGPFSPEKIRSIDSPVILEEAETVLLDLLPSFPVDARLGILAINDDAALGALAAFEKADRLDQVVAVGQNADRLGRAALRRLDLPFVGTTSYGPEHYGERLLEAALRILRGEPVPPAIYNRHVFITKENVNEYYPEVVDEHITV